MSNLNKTLRSLRQIGIVVFAMSVGSTAWALQVPADTSQAVADTLEEEVNVILVQDVPTVPAELLKKRLAGLEKTIPLTYNKSVHGFVDFFTFRKPSYSQKFLERIPMFFPLYERYLEHYGMPDELKYLSIVESSLVPKAVSVASAGGLWQFMPGTGRDMGLYQDEYIDERMDPVKSTDAACRYLRDLYRIFNDWHLALAAYNSGPGTVKRAMRRSGGDSFWTIYDYLPKETRAYVPQFIALNYVMNYANDHGIYAANPQYTIPCDTIHVNSYFCLQKFSKFTSIPLEDLQKMNPCLVTTILPEHTRNFVLRVPTDRFDYFKANRKYIMDSVTVLPTMTPNMLLATAENYTDDTNGSLKKRDWFPFTDSNEQQSVRVVVAANSIVEEGADLEEVIQKKPRKVIHTVKRGEVMDRIAQKYDIDVYDLKAWNRLKSARLTVGQKLVILREASPANKSLAKKESVEKEEVVARKTREYKPRYHTVQQGDTLWNISKRYGGVSVEDLKKLNNIKDETLKAGQKIIVG
ncbi:lytic transglycosylase domain-containing protein [Tellurirhabdus bombi]|uniref:lytic transglycosylase domain-containing protein n=1 Tax=Tellurirhabdus bombi TaxID=2907205 RepID=UPI001F34FCFB|nr:lytic transglycosylase domain-containing protein [Tellurirhabdus bombi]